MTEFTELLGKTMKSVTATRDTMTFERDDGKKFMFYHEQDCCESVSIDDICGELEDLVGSPLIIAEEISSEGAANKGEWEDSFTWTFYRFATEKGWVVVKWYGSSNGYYSESVNFMECQ